MRLTSWRLWLVVVHGVAFHNVKARTKVEAFRKCERRLEELVKFSKFGVHPTKVVEGGVLPVVIVVDDVRTGGAK